MLGASQPPWYLRTEEGYVRTLRLVLCVNLQLPEIVGCFVVAPDDECQDRCRRLTCVVPIIRPHSPVSNIVSPCHHNALGPREKRAHLLCEPAELLVLVRDGHACEVAVVADRLEVAADEE